MKSKLTGFTFALIIMMGTLPVFAITITDTYGDQDGFGTGVAAGDVFFPWDVVTEADDEGFTDRWVFGPQTWSHSYDISGLTNITSASLSVFSGGQGLVLTSELYIDGNYVDDLTDGEYFGFNVARNDVFDLSAYAGLLNGSNTLEVRTFLNFDAWVLDYSELSITGDYVNPNGPQAPVPEPATLSLLGIGLAGMALRKRAMRA